ARRRDLLLALDEEPHTAALNDRHLLVRVIVLRSHEKRLESETTDHHAVTDEHLSFDAVGRVLNGDIGPVQMSREVETVTVTVAVPVVLRRGGRHARFLYFLSLTASSPEPLAAYSGCTFTTP